MKKTIIKMIGFAIGRFIPFASVFFIGYVAYPHWYLVFLFFVEAIAFQYLITLIKNRKHGKTA